MFSRFQQAGTTPLSYQTTGDLSYTAAQSNVPLAQLQAMAEAQGHMQAAKESEGHIEIPKVNFFPSTHSNPRKARRKDIKQAYRLLTPTKRSPIAPRRWWFGGKYRYNKNTSHCAIDGCDVEYLMRIAGNIYEQIKDEETGRSLWDMYFHNPVSGEVEAFIAREGVTSGRKLSATYCPEHLHLYHLLCKWETEEEIEQEAQSGTLKSKLRKGVSTVAIPLAVIQKKDNTPPQLLKYAPFLNMLKEDKIPIIRMKNTQTGMNDLTMVIFDMRQFQNDANLPLLQALGEAHIAVPPPMIPTIPAGSGLQMMMEEKQNQLPPEVAPEV
jgi:hypothetical protein